MKRRLPQTTVELSNITLRRNAPLSPVGCVTLRDMKMKCNAPPIPNISVRYAFLRNAAQTLTHPTGLLNFLVSVLCRLG